MADTALTTVAPALASTEARLVPQRFDFESFGLRVLERNGQPWFMAADLVKVLGYQDTSYMTRMLEPDEFETASVVVEGAPTGRKSDPHNVGVRLEDAENAPHFVSSQRRNMIVVSESGLYAVILKSRRPEATRFRRWVTSEVLPQLRRTGTYAVQSARGSAELVETLLADPQLLIGTLDRYARALIATTAKLREAEKENSDLWGELGTSDHHNRKLEDEIAAIRGVTEADGALTLTATAKVLGVGPKRFIAFLQNLRWIYRRGQASEWLGNDRIVQQGWLTHRVARLARADGPDKVVEQVRVTPTGLVELRRIYDTAR